MEKEKFHFIELPKPELTITEFGMSEILGGALCSHYIVCVSTGSDNKYNGETECSDPIYRGDLDCNGNPIGCEGGLHCTSYFQPCAGTLQSTSCTNFKS